MAKSVYPDTFQTELNGNVLTVSEDNQLIAAYDVKRLANRLVLGVSVTKEERAMAGACILHMLASESKEPVASPKPFTIEDARKEIKRRGEVQILRFHKGKECDDELLCFLLEITETRLCGVIRNINGGKPIAFSVVHNDKSFATAHGGKYWFENMVKKG